MSNLRVELVNLQSAIRVTDNYMRQLSEEFRRNGGVCCPSCGVPEYSILMSKQERRRERIKQIQLKLSKQYLGSLLTKG